MKKVAIAIDGPSGAGKSTISKTIARDLGILYIDTGAMYRAVGLFGIQNGIDIKQEADKLSALLPGVSITLAHENGAQQVFLNGENVTDQIRTPEVSIAASDVAVIPAVRLFLVELQRGIAAEQSVIMDGRDIGTYVLPDADIKIFLTASLDDRARRRYLELQEKGVAASFEEVKKDMAYRDQNDSSRAFAPLSKADDAILADTTGKTLEEAVSYLSSLIKSRL